MELMFFFLTICYFTVHVFKVSIKPHLYTIIDHDRWLAPFCSHQSVYYKSLIH